MTGTISHMSRHNFNFQIFIFLLWASRVGPRSLIFLFYHSLTGTISPMPHFHVSSFHFPIVSFPGRQLLEPSASRAVSLLKGPSVSLLYWPLVSLLKGPPVSLLNWPPVSLLNWPPAPWAPADLEVWYFYFIIVFLFEFVKIGISRISQAIPAVLNTARKKTPIIFPALEENHFKIFCGLHV